MSIWFFIAVNVMAFILILNPAGLVLFVARWYDKGFASAWKLFKEFVLQVVFE